MEALLKKVRQIEIKAKRMSQNVFAGQYHSAFKGRGMAFSEVRDYQIGDDVRDIDWNVTARYAHPFIKVFEEERELTVFLLIDLSGSTTFGSKSSSKREVISEIAATLAFSAISAGNKVGAIIFTDRVEMFIPPKNGKKHILFIIRELLGFEPQGKCSNPEVALTFMSKIVKKSCTVFLLSDFMDDPTAYENALAIAASKKDLVALRVWDRRDAELPNIGLIKLKDAETNGTIWVDTSSKKARERYAIHYANQYEKTKKIFGKYKIDFAEVATGEDYVPSLIKLFKGR